MRNCIALGITIALVATIGCRGNTAAPSSPSPLPEATTAAPPAAPGPNTGAGAVISGTVRPSSAPSATGFRGVAASIVVQVIGTDLAAIANSTGAFTLNGVPPGDITLRITGPGMDGTVGLGAVQTGQTLQVAIVFTGSLPVISADSRVNEGQKRELEGQIQTMQPPNRFVLNYQIVEVTPGATQIRHGSRSLAYADLAVGQRVHVRGSSNVTPSETVLRAEWIELQNDGTPTPGEMKAIEGRVDTPFPVSGSCSSFPLVFKVSGKTVRADASTSFVPGCQALAAGATVEVKGLLLGDGVLAASVVKVKEAPSEVELNGTVLALVEGSCGGKNLAFTVTPKRGLARLVRTTAATTFNSPCSGVTVGASVEVKGMQQPDGSIVAAKVAIETRSETQEIKGRVDTPFPTSGSCTSFPLVFKVSGKTVRADASTSFVPGCQALAAGANVEVKGLLLADGALAASVVKVEHVSSEVELEGTVLALVEGTCGASNLAFTVKSKSGLTQLVKTAAATKFDSACSKLTVGARVKVKGVLQPGGSILASKVEIDDAHGLVEFGTMASVPAGSAGGWGGA